MRSLLLVSFFLLPAMAAAAVENGVPAAGVTRCDVQEPTFDSRKVVCTFEPRAETRRYRLQVNFAGGHDDTTASLVMALNGVAAACQEGSKPELMGEDGDVSLTCLFTVAAAEVRPTFTVVFTWNHAQYVDYSLSAR